MASAARICCATLACRGRRILIGHQPPVGDDVLFELRCATVLRAQLLQSRLQQEREDVARRCRLCDEEFVLVCSSELNDSIDGDLLHTEPAKAVHRPPLLACAETLPIIRRWWRHVLHVPPPGRAVLVAPDLRALQAAAESGLGATVLPRYMCADDLASGRLVEVLPTDDPPINTLDLATRLHTRGEPHIAHVASALLREAEQW